MWCLGWALVAAALAAARSRSAVTVAVGLVDRVSRALCVGVSVCWRLCVGIPGRRNRKERESSVLDVESTVFDLECFVVSSSCQRIRWSFFGQ